MHDHEWTSPLDHSESGIPALDRGCLGALNVEQWSIGMERACRFRSQSSDVDHRFFDIDFRAMTADPVGVVRRLYEWLGQSVSAD